MLALLPALLLLAAPSALADAVKIAESHGTTYYVDRAAVVFAGDVRRAWVVHDYAGEQPGGVRSRRVLYEIHCAAGRLRSLAVTEHAQPMAQDASAKASERESEWVYVAPRTGSHLAPRTPYAPIVRFVCAA